MYFKSIKHTYKKVLIKYTKLVQYHKARPSVIKHSSRNPQGRATLVHNISINARTLHTISTLLISFDAFHYRKLASVIKSHRGVARKQFRGSNFEGFPLDVVAD